MGCILDHFDLLIGDSQYNIQSLAQYLTRPMPALPIYPVIDPARLKEHPYDESLFEHLRSTGQVNILFVGRIARNKRQDRLMRVFDYYYREISPRAHLWLVGNENGDPAYRAELEQLRLSLAACDQVHFTGKISDMQIYAYYRAADLFLSASEHEGFGVPLVEATAFDIPVIAYASSAVPETMGQAGTLVYDWDAARVAELIQLVTHDEPLKVRLLAGQRYNLNRFSINEAAKRLQVAIQYLRSGQGSNLFEAIDHT